MAKNTVSRRSFIQCIGAAAISQACGGRTEDEMPSGSKTQTIDLLPGIREDIDENSAPPGTLRVAKNVRYGRMGGIYPRYGTKRITTASTASAHSLVAFRNTGPICSLGDIGMLGVAGKMFARDATGSIFDFAGLYSSCLPIRRRNGLVSEANSGVGKSRHGVAINSDGYVLMAASDGVNVNFFIESADGVRLLYGTRTGTKAACLSVGSSLYLFLQDGTFVTVIRFLVTAGVVTVAGSVGAAGILNSASDYWDVTPSDPAQGDWYLAHQTTATNIRIERWTNITSVSSADVTVSVAGTPISLYADATEVWLGWHNNPGVTGEVRYRTIQTNLAAFRSAVTTIATDPDYGPPLFGPSGSTGVAFYVFRDRSNYVSALQWGTGSSPGNAALAGTVVGPTVCWNMTPISKPDSQQRVWCLSNIQTAAKSTSQLLLLRWRTPSVADATGMTIELADDESPLQLFTATPDYFHHVAETTEGLLMFTGPIGLRSSAATNGLYGVNLYEYENDNSHPWRDTAELGTSCVVAGQPVQFFGHSSGRIYDAGFLADPAAAGAAEVGFAPRQYIFSATPSAAFGSLTPGAQYSWVVVPEWIDMLNQRHRGQPSAPITTTLGASDNQVALDISLLSIGQRQESNTDSHVVAHVYRLVQGAYRRVTPDVGAPAIWTGSFMVTYTDTMSDADALDNEILYTDGGVKEFTLAPSSRFLCATEQRVWFGGLWDPRVIQSSRFIIPGEPLECSSADGFKVLLPEANTGLAYQDGTVIGFCKRAIYLISGEGPSDTGQGTWSAPRALTKQLGCVNYLSILETSEGVLFQSERGIYIIPRGFGSPIFVGGPVQETLKTYPNCIGSAVHADAREHTARFLMSNDDGTAVVVLKLDLNLSTQVGYGVWSVDERTGVGATMTNMGRWPTGTLHTYDSDNIGTYIGLLEELDGAEKCDADSTIGIETRVTTASYSPAGHAGQWRCMSVCGALSDSDAGANLKMNLTTDDDTTADTLGATLTVNTGSIYRAVAPKRANCTDLVVDFVLTRSASPSQALGCAIHGYTVELEEMPGARRTSTSER